VTRYAVIDLGSNTFHLLIVQLRIDGGFDVVFRKRVFTGLSDGGIQVIKEEKIIIGLETIKDFAKILEDYDNPQLRVLGTAVLRKASNRSIFIAKAESILKTKINIIDGIQEADYIYKGMTLHQELQKETHLIMDVGGGSTELILIVDGTKKWANSYPLGVGMLHERFHNTEPISSLDLQNLIDHVHSVVTELPEIVTQYQPSTLVGASGSFEILQMMAGIPSDPSEISIIDNERFLAIYKKIITSDEGERYDLQGLPYERVKLIVVGMALKKAIFDMIQPKKILVSPFALKEGVLREMIERKV
jgi:exopolyphosphatase/guanosine-5'-triphosphate,3'-diphosphate pyrophosphatase